MHIYFGLRARRCGERYLQVFNGMGRSWPGIEEGTNFREVGRQLNVQFNEVLGLGKSEGGC